MRKLAVILSFALLFCAFSGAAGADDKFCDVKIKVLKDETGRPIRNASVVLHSVNSKGKQGSGGLQLKTNAEGETSYSGIPYGTLRVQIILHGFQTYGEDFDIDAPTKDIVVRLKPPTKQYSIYDDHGKAAEKKDDDKKPKKDDQPK